jgi:hypothetical protein
MMPASITTPPRPRFPAAGAGKMFVNRLEHSGPGGRPIEHASATDLQLARWIAFILRMADSAEA